jgi:hypothetical protein
LAAVDGAAIDDQAARELPELEQLVAGVESADDLLGAVQITGLDDADVQFRADDADVVTNAALAQLRPQIRLVRGEVLPHGLIEIDLVEEMDAAAQV